MKRGREHLIIVSWVRGYTRKWHESLTSPL